MSILNPKSKKGDKKNAASKNGGQASKFITNKSALKNSSGFAKKPMTGGTQRGS